MKYLKIGLTWLLQLLLAIVMIGPGTAKFTSPTWEHMFRKWGYPDGFYLVIGAVEVIAGIGLLIPRVTSYSAVVLAIVMLGASATQVLRGGRNGVGEIVLASLLAVLAFIRWRDRFRTRPVTPTEAPAAF